MSRERSKARSLAAQALYQWQMAGQPVSDILGQFLAEHAERKFDRDYFRDLLEGVPRHLEAIDGALAEALDRDIERVDPVERAILRLGTYELLQHPEIPYKVAINEAVELAKLFGAEQGHRYVNGVLDKTARRLRAIETS